MYSKVLDMGSGMAIYKTDLDDLREQDVNARVMTQDKFELLVANIKKDQRLESLPLCVKRTNHAGNEELLIVSGHHRTRASRKAGLKEIYTLVMEENINEDYIKSKQLSHNALIGYDDPQTLKAIFDSIRDIEAKLACGVTDEDIKFQLDKINVDEIKLQIDFEVVNLIFLPEHKNKFEDVIKMLLPKSEVLVADMAVFEKFREAVKTSGRLDNIRNVSAILNRMCDIVLKFYSERRSEKDDTEI